MYGAGVAQASHVFVQTYSTARHGFTPPVGEDRMVTHLLVASSALT